MKKGFGLFSPSRKILGLPEWGGGGASSRSDRNPQKIDYFFCSLECIKEMTSSRSQSPSLTSRLSRTLSSLPSLPSTNTYIIKITFDKSAKDYAVILIHIIILCIVFQILNTILVGK
jgi:hypothetical protein